MCRDDLNSTTLGRSQNPQNFFSLSGDRLKINKKTGKKLVIFESGDRDPIIVPSTNQQTLNVQHGWPERHLSLSSRSNRKRQQGFEGSVNLQEVVLV